MELERATELDRVMLRLQEWESLKGMNKVSKPARLEKLEEMAKVMTSKRYRIDVTGLELYLLHYPRMGFFLWVWGEGAVDGDGNEFFVGGVWEWLI